MLIIIDSSYNGVSQSIIIANPIPIVPVNTAQIETLEGIVAAVLGATLSAILEPAVAVHWSPQE